MNKMADSIRAATVSDTIHRLEEHLTCAICLDQYRGPKTLPCHHNFCQECLEQSISQTPLCPTCRRPVLLPSGGVASLPPAFLINNFLELHSQLKGTAGEGCSQHKRPLEAFCKCCKSLVCLVCTATIHKSHDFELTEGIQERLMIAVGEVRKEISSAQDALAMLGTREKEILDQELAVKHQIFFLAHMEHAEQYVKDLLDELAMRVKQKQVIIALQSKDAQDKIKRMQDCLYFVQTASVNSSLEKLFAQKDDILQRITLSLSDVRVAELRPAEDADVVFVEEVKVMNTGRKMLGKLKCSQLHHKCRVLGLKSTMMLAESACELVVRENSEAFIPIPMTLVSCRLVANCGPQPTADCTVKQVGPGRFKISYEPRAYGPHQLRILVGIVDVPGSPFTSLVPPPAPLERGQQLCVLSQTVSLPGSVTVSSKTGHVVIAEWGLDCITVLDSKGRRKQSFGSFGSKPGKFNCPWGVALAQDNQIVVSDQWNDRIQVFNMEGKLISSVGSGGKGPLHFLGPMGIVVLPSSDIFVAESRNNRIQVLAKNLSFSHIFVTHLEPPLNPCALAGDRQGMLYIADSNHHRVCKYSQTGELLATFGKKGSKPGQLKHPAGIAIDSKDHIYISEKGNHRVSVFTSSGQFLHCFGRYGEKEGELNQPLGIAVDNGDNVYVCDSGNNRLLVF